MSSNNALNQSIDDLIEFLNSGDKQLLRPFDQNSDKNNYKDYSLAPEGCLINDKIENLVNINQDKISNNANSVKKEKENIENELLKELLKTSDEFNSDFKEQANNPT